MKPLLLLFASLVGITTFAQLAGTDKEIKLLDRVIEKNHISPKPLDDQFSSQLFYYVLDQLDENKLYLSQQDIKDLENWKTKLDDGIKSNDAAFAGMLSTVWIKALANAGEIIKNLETVAIKPANSGSFIYNKQTPFPADAFALKARWSQYFTFRVLSELYDQHENDSLDVSVQQLLKEEPVARKKVADILQKNLQEKLAHPQSLQQWITHLYFNSIANLYDPHTEYVEPEEKQQFDESLSSEKMMFGFAMAEKDGSYNISSLVPGSPAWNSGSIHVNDKITQIKTSEGIILKMGEASREDISKAFNNPNAQLEITVLSADGKSNTVKLKKEAVTNNENFVKGYILTHNGKKTGYIALPSFYSEWDEGKLSSSCANDVAKEIVKLKREGIDGLLIDLRYNGGGSLGEALELSGIFIDAGPLSLVKENSGKVHILKDPARGTIYDGPRGVMINGQSASASELVAGALQDYNRALIIGGSSFGKATMQFVFPMDTNYNYLEPPVNYKPNPDKGFVKVTTGKLYRINGKTNQLNGVVPDIALPDPVEVFEYTERKMHFALDPDTTMKHVVYTALSPMPVAALAQKSNARVKSSPYFQSVTGDMKILKKIYSEKMIPLQWEEYVQWEKSIKGSAGHDDHGSSNYFTISNSTLDNRIMQLDEYENELNEDLKEDILKDKYIEEALRIMEDLVNMPK
jgi:carboxyl-terminal processing protease